MAQKIIINIDGGIGRVIAATGAIRRYKEKNPEHQIIILTAWPEVFTNNPNIYKLYNLNHPYIWDDIVQYGIFIHLEPYHDHNYYNQRHSLAQSFNFLLNGEQDTPKPELFLNDLEKAWATKLIGEVRGLTKRDIIGTFQPYGAGAKLQENKEILDDSFRSLSREVSHKIAAAVPAQVGLMNCSTIFMDSPIVANRNNNLRELFALVWATEFFLGIDSCCLHAAAAFGKPGIVLIGATYKENVSYPSFIHASRPGYPKSYAPNRFSGAINLNKGATDFTDEEIAGIAAKVKEMVEAKHDEG